jgi:hypothetical protein
MPQQTNLIKIISIGLAIVIGVVAILVFSGKISLGESTTQGTQNKTALRVWGTLPQESIKGALDQYTLSSGKILQVSYTEYSRENIVNALLRANANNDTPDLVIAPHEELLALSDLSYIIPYTYFSETEYKNTFIDGSHKFATPYGSLFIPFLADPLITFYNKKVFSAKGFTKPPEVWDDLIQYQKDFTVIDQYGKPDFSAFALGSYKNIVNASNVLFANLNQLGIPLVITSFGTDENGNFMKINSSNVGASSDGNYNSSAPLEQILRFQMAFSDPQKKDYFTWSETDSSDIDKFIAGRLGVYYGLSSEIGYLKSKNSNLDIGITYFTQTKKGEFATVGNLYGISILKGNKDFQYAIDSIKVFTSRDFSLYIAKSLNMASARKDTLLGNDGSEKSDIVGRSALVQKTFFNSTKAKSEALVFNLYDNLLSGRKNLKDAISTFSDNWYGVYNTQ